MRYMGGKGRVAKSIRDSIKDHVPNRDVTYWEPFVGGCGAFQMIAPEFSRSKASDVHEDLILMWKGVQKGWTPPDSITPNEYAQLKGEHPSAKRGFVGFGGSFSGKWFGGYAKGGINADGTPRNHLAESARNVLRTAKVLGGLDVTFTNCGYPEIEPSTGDVVYCDPPYRGTTEYDQTGFDSDEFFSWADGLVKSGVRVFISEYEAPDGWIAVGGKDLVKSTSLSSTRTRVTDKLFMHETQVYATH